MIDETTFLPIVGYPMAQKQMLDDYEDGKISFEQACMISVVNSAIYAGTTIAAAQTNYVAAMQFQRLGTAIMSPVTYGAIGLAVGVHAATKPGATYEVDHYRTVRVMPKLGISLMP